MWPLAIYFGIVVVLVTGMLLVSYVLGQRHIDPATDETYESGIVSEGSAHVRLSAKFYLIAVFFVIIDLETVFLFAWAVSAQALGWPAFWEAAVFVAVLFAALIYLWLSAPSICTTSAEVQSDADPDTKAGVRAVASE